jgi:hypothetical protein
MENIYDSQINTFTGGMNLDTDPLFVKEDQYREAYNFRLTKSVDAITGVLENSVGNRKIISLSHIIDKDFEIVGHCVIRNYIVLFVRRVYAGNNGKYIIDSKIIRINTTPEQGRDIYSEIPLSNIVAIYEDSDSLGRFNFGHIIKCVGRWVNDKNVKVYWTDFYHDDRPEPHLKDFDDSERAPLMSYNIVDDSNKNKSVSYFNQTITAILNTPYDLSLISGGLRSGVYQYIYRIITDDGSSSNWSSPSILFPVSSNYGKDDANDYWDSEDVQIGSTNDVKKSNHGVQISIDIPNIDSAQRIEVCRIYYAGTTSNPKYYKIKIRENIETGEIGKVKIVTDTVDDGVEIASFTQSGKDPSYGVASDNINICAKDIVSNRDTLYAANIKEISFVKNINDSNFEEFDTRAYRFNDFGECWL